MLKIMCALGVHEWEYIHDYHKIFSKEHRVCRNCGKRQTDMNFGTHHHTTPNWVSVRHERYPKGFHDKYIKGK